MRVGFTATIPVEVIIAAGAIPVDLNNIFITARDPRCFISQAEAAGFPSALCSWVKGIYGAVKEAGVDRIIVVVDGDCSSNKHLADVLRSEGLEVFAFSYPHDRSPERLAGEIQRLSAWLSVSVDAAESVRNELRGVRASLSAVDTMSFTDLTVTGRENHEWLVSSSDFCGDHHDFKRRCDHFLAEVKKREPRYKKHVRLGYIGVPPIVSDLYPFIEEHGGVILFNEVQRQFAMLDAADSLVAQYAHYTYPYTFEERLVDIQQAIAERRLDGVVHYIQSFCSHAIEDIVLRKKLSVPLLSIECDQPGRLDGKNKTKIEAFLERWR